MLDLTRERQVSVTDSAWDSFTAQAARMGLDTCQALTAALRQWVVLGPGEGHCPHCGAVLCETDHHLWWCSQAAPRGSEAPGTALREAGTPA